MISRFPHGLAALLLASCVTPYNRGDANAIANNSGDSVFRSHYIIRPGTAADWDTRIDFSRVRIAFSRTTSSSEARNASDAGGRIRIAEIGDVFHIVNEPFFAPTFAQENWKIGRFSCTAEHHANTARIECLSETGVVYSSLYDQKKGLVWFDYFCASYTTKLCRYELESQAGLFSEEMISRLKSELH